MPNQGGWETDNFLRGTYHAAALAYIPMVLRRSRFLRFTASFDRKLPLDRSCRILPPVYPFGRCQRTNALDISAVAPGSFGRDRADCFPVDRRAGFQCLAWFGALGLHFSFRQFLGQICLRYALLWLLLAGPLLILFDMIGFRSGGPWPHYKLI